MVRAGMLWALGLMSGTSLDGVDAALIRTDGSRIEAFGPTLFRPYDDVDRSILIHALQDAAGIIDRRQRPGRVAEAERIVTDVHTEAVRDLCSLAAREGIIPDVVGFHGQTVLHAPERRLTVQIGDAGRLSRISGRPVVHDFRAADVEAGGHGAPLVPLYHRALAERAGVAMPAAILNIGGVANITVLTADGGILAFDTGPGNALIDDLVRETTGARCDHDGHFAAHGRIDDTALGALLDHPYFSKPPPKSLDRNAFSRAPVAGLGFEDAVATLTAFTAETVARALRTVVGDTAAVVVAGGGAHNPVLMRMLAERTGASVVKADELGIDGDFVEAQAFGFLAVRRLAGLPATLPTTTGAPHEMIGGVVIEPGRLR